MAATLVWFSGGEAGGRVGGFGGEFDTYDDGGTGTPPSHVTSPVRTGTYALKTPHDTRLKVQTNYTSNSTVFFRSYFKAGVPTNTVCVLVGNANTFATARGWRIYLTSTGKIGWGFSQTSGSAPDGIGATSFDTVGWNLLEVKFVRDAAAGGLEIFLNGTLQVSDFTHATTSGTSATNTRLHFGNDLDQPGTNQSGEDIFFDDLALATGGYIGAGGSIAVQGKAGAPTYDTFTKNGDTTAALCWSQTPWSSAKNCSTSTINSNQTMLVDDTALGSLVPAGATINGAFIGAVAIAGAASSHIHALRRLAGVDTVGGVMPIPTGNDLFVPNGVDIDPMGIFVDTLSNLQALEIGVQAHPGSGTETIEDVWLFVDYAPSPNTTITPSAGSLVITGQPALASDSDSPNIQPQTGTVTLTGQPAHLNTIDPGTGAVSLVGGQALVFVTSALTVTFMIADEVVRYPLNVIFDIMNLDQPVVPLTVKFDVEQAQGDPLTVTFDILGDIVNRRLKNDVQGPVAKVTLS